MNDIIDFAEEAADYLGLYGIEAPMEQAQQLSGILVAAARAVEGAVPSIRDFGDATEAIHEVHRLENDGDRLSRDAIAALFHNGIDPMVVIRRKDIYQRLEQGIDACEHAADVIDEIIVESDIVTPTVIFAALIGAITWNLVTWWFGLPSSSSHALIGGVVGAALAAAGTGAIQVSGLVSKVLIPGLVAPILAFVVAGVSILTAYLIAGAAAPAPPPTASAWANGRRAASSRSLTGRTTPRRRWA